MCDLRHRLLQQAPDGPRRRTRFLVILLKYRIRRYGFHGTSHQFVSRAAAELVGRDLGELNQIVLHLGNGCSASAVRRRCCRNINGADAAPGFGDGHPFRRCRSGAAHLPAQRARMSIGDIDTLLNKQSGLKGMAGVNDFRELEQRRAAGDEAAQLAFEVYVHRQALPRRVPDTSGSAGCAASPPASRRTTRHCGQR